MIRVLIADDHAVVRSGGRSLDLALADAMVFDGGSTVSRTATDQPREDF